MHGSNSSVSALALISGTLSTAKMSRILATVPKSPRWQNGIEGYPWGLGQNSNYGRPGHALYFEPVRIGKKAWFFQSEPGVAYDTIREAFVQERLNSRRQECDCIRFETPSLSEAMVDCDTQLDFMSSVLKRVLLEMSEIDLASLTTDLFAGQRHLCEHYLWWLESEHFIAHPYGEVSQDRLALTDEGCAVLYMLEMTKPGSNHDLSPETVHRLIQAGEPLIDWE